MGLLALFGINLNPLSYLGSFINGMFSAALKLFGQSASDVVTALLGFITTTSDPVFSGGWWSSSGEAVFARVLVVSASLMALAFMLSVITALLAGDPKVLMKAVLHLPLAIIQMGLLVTVTAALLSATDEVSSYIATGASHSLKSFVTVGMIAAIADSSVVGLIIGALIILAAISVWLQLIVRTALLYVAVLGAPLIFAASVHPSVRGLQKRYIEFGIGLICAKVVVALAFATGAAALGSVGSSPSFSAEVGALLESLAILLIACFAPYLFIRLLIGAEALIVAEGLERRPLRAAMHSQQASYYLRAGGGLSGLLHGMGGSGKGGGPSAPGSDPGASTGPSSPSGGNGGGSPGTPQPAPSSNGGSARSAAPAKAAAAASTTKPAPAGLHDARAALRQATSKRGDSNGPPSSGSRAGGGDESSGRSAPSGRSAHAAESASEVRPAGSGSPRGTATGPAPRNIASSAPVTAEARASASGGHEGPREATPHPPPIGNTSSVPGTAGTPASQSPASEARSRDGSPGVGVTHDTARDLPPTPARNATSSARHRDAPQPPTPRSGTADSAARRPIPPTEEARP